MGYNLLDTGDRNESGINKKIIIIMKWNAQTQYFNTCSFLSDLEIIIGEQNNLNTRKVT